MSRPSQTGPFTLPPEEMAVAYSKVRPDIAALSREELAIILSGLHARVVLNEAEWKHRPPLISSEIAARSECPSISRLFAALVDHRSLAFMEDCLMALPGRNANSGADASVYVAEFSDGHVKIGFSISPDARIKSIAGGNQARLTRQWHSAKIASASEIEASAHRHFREQRAGGEFFNVPFGAAVEWIKHQVEQQLAVH